MNNWYEYFCTQAPTSFALLESACGAACEEPSHPANLMTVPQVLTIWVARDAGGVSLLSWAAYLVSACLRFVYGLQKHDKTIYLACIGWIVLDAAIVAGVVVYR